MKGLENPRLIDTNVLYFFDQIQQNTLLSLNNQQPRTPLKKEFMVPPARIELTSKV